LFPCGLLAGDTEARGERYISGCPYSGPLTVVINVRNYTHSELQFRARLTEGVSNLTLI
jgi:hypothetical protein